LVLEHHAHCPVLDLDGETLGDDRRPRSQEVGIEAVTVRSAPMSPRPSLPRTINRPEPSTATPGPMITPRPGSAPWTSKPRTWQVHTSVLQPGQRQVQILQIFSVVAAIVRAGEPAPIDIPLGPYTREIHNPRLLPLLPLALALPPTASAGPAVRDPSTVERATGPRLVC
jgi:hypothetical protein